MYILSTDLICIYHKPLAVIYRRQNIDVGTTHQHEYEQYVKRKSKEWWVVNNSTKIIKTKSHHK
jgi:hypothetical protein